MSGPESGARDGAPAPDGNARERGAGPLNPTNGHPFECDCWPCLIYWDSRVGADEYAAHLNRIAMKIAGRKR